MRSTIDYGGWSKFLLAVVSVGSATLCVMM